MCPNLGVIRCNVNMPNELFAYMKDATRGIQSEYERISARSKEDPGTAGDNGEENWAELLRKWLPKHYHVVTKGRVMNAKGECSPQVDVLVLSPYYPPALIDKKEYLDAGVLAAFECKLTLEAHHIQKAVENARDIARLLPVERERTPFNELYSTVTYGLLAHSHIWTKPNSAPQDNIARGLLADTEKTAGHPRELIDIVCVADVATWQTVKMLFAGSVMLQQLAARYQTNAALWAKINAERGVIETHFICSSSENQLIKERSSLFTPLGAFITAILNRLAWTDNGIRSLAQYFTVAELGGSGTGGGAIWSYSLLSQQLRTEISEGARLTTGMRWSKWSMIL